MYNEPIKVICRITGNVVGSNYVAVGINGKKGARFYDLRLKKTKCMSKAKFDLLYRAEDCK